ncbi:MAG TPA: hypothetical protein VFA15_03890, partial [Nitrososphaera sp.]|nr:hypothetical protein [Nitrososphaera sp.]
IRVNFTTGKVETPLEGEFHDLVIAGNHLDELSIEMGFKFIVGLLLGIPRGFRITNILTRLSRPKPVSSN